MRGFHHAKWAEDPSYLENSAGNRLFNEVSLRWSELIEWKKADKKPKIKTEKPFLYVLVRAHGNSAKTNNIIYVGLTKFPKTRFGNHETAHAQVAKNGKVLFSYADVNFVYGRNSLEKIERALEELEHLLVWALEALDHKLVNQKKQFTLPGLGKNGGHAWIVANSGYRFSGRMPQKIVYPWMLLKIGRDRSTKNPKTTTGVLS